MIEERLDDDTPDRRAWEQWADALKPGDLADCYTADMAPLGARRVMAVLDDGVEFEGLGLVPWEYIAQPWDGTLDDGDTPDSEAWASQAVD